VLCVVKQHTPLGDPANLAPSGNEGRNGRGMYFMFLLLPLCCGLPLIVVALAATSALTKGLVIGVAVALVATVVMFLVRRPTRANAACCVPPRVAGSVARHPVDHRP